MPREEHLAEVPGPLPSHPVQNHLHHTLAARHRSSVVRKQLQLALQTLPVENRDRPAPRRPRRPVHARPGTRASGARTARGPHRLQRVVAMVLAVLAAVVDLEKHAGQDCARRSPRNNEGRSVLHALLETPPQYTGLLTRHPRPEKARFRGSTAQLRLEGFGRDSAAHAGGGEAGVGRLGRVGEVDDARHHDRARCSRRGGRSSRASRGSRARISASRSSTVQATQWLLASPATITASNDEEVLDERAVRRRRRRCPPRPPSPRAAAPSSSRSGGCCPLISTRVGDWRAIEWKKTASSTAETRAWPMPPSIEWYGHTTSGYLPALGEAAGVVDEPRPRRRSPRAGRTAGASAGVHAPAPALDVGERDHRVRRGVLAVARRPRRAGGRSARRCACRGSPPPA